MHLRDVRGEQTLDPRACDAAVSAIRAAVPGIGVGLSTAEAIDRDPFARAAAISRWRQRPDFTEFAGIPAGERPPHAGTPLRHKHG